MTKAEWHDWRKHPGTVEFLKVVRAEREEITDAIGKGLYADDSARLNQLIGKFGAFDRVTEITHEGD